LFRDLSETQITDLSSWANSQLLTTDPADNLLQIKSSSVHLTVTSPPFLNIVNYKKDNWLRCWFNGIDPEQISKSILSTPNIDIWAAYMESVFKELYRITRKDGRVAFETGEIPSRKVKLEEIIFEAGQKAGFKLDCFYINRQKFTKTSHIWGVSNNKAGTNTNRISVFVKL